jgi:hypothetical protein
MHARGCGPINIGLCIHEGSSIMYLSSKLKGAVCAFVLASSSTGALAQVGPGVLGLYNPATGAFQPAPPARLMTEESEGTPRAAVNRTGRIIINIQIDIDTNIGGTTVPSCSASISHSPTSFPDGHLLLGISQQDFRQDRQYGDLPNGHELPMARGQYRLSGDRLIFRFRRQPQHEPATGVVRSTRERRNKDHQPERRPDLAGHRHARGPGPGRHRLCIL